MRCRVYFDLTYISPTLIPPKNNQIKGDFSMLSLRLLLATLFTLFLISVVFNGSVQSQDASLKKPVNDVTVIPTANSNVWNKFIGKTVPAGTPDIIDWSYAGYKNGREFIPEATGRIIDVTDEAYGAIPNDNLSDTQAIKNAFREANISGSVIIYFPPGQYDIFMDGDSKNSYVLQKNNIVIKGAGGQGSANGGTTIKMHNRTTDDHAYLFTMDWKAEGYRDATRLSANATRGAMFVDVVNSSGLNRTGFVKIVKYGVKDDTSEIWTANCSKSKSDMHRDHTEIRNGGFSIEEFHEIDRIEGNRVYLRSPITTPLDTSALVFWQDVFTNIGIEDFHVDCGQLENYVHLKSSLEGRHVINYGRVANSWIRRLRLSNTTNAITISKSLNISVYSIIIDGIAGHHPISINWGSTNCFVGLFEIHTNKTTHHGVTVSKGSVSNVFWKSGGEFLNGPDAHGKAPRYNLFDNYFSKNYQSSGGVAADLPHHLDGYVRWNNKVDSSSNIDSWKPGGYGYTVTQPVIVGLITGGSPTYSDAYIESMGSHVNPQSLFEAQLLRRTNTNSAWLYDILRKHRAFFNAIFNPTISAAPVFPLGLKTSIQVDENTDTDTDIGSPFIATDVNNDTLTYSLEGDDKSSFKIDSSTSQLETKDALDYETKSSYSLTIVVTDSDNQEARIDISISINDINEFMPVSERTPAVASAIASAFRHKNSVAFTPEEVTDDHLPLIYHLVIDSNDINALKLGDFDGLSKLKYLTIHNTRISTLPAGIFDDCVSIFQLYLMDNKIKELPHGVFQNLTKLRYLFLENNRLKVLPRETFTGLERLIELKLSNNRLTTLGKNTFNDLTNMTRLELNGNKLKTLPRNIFSNQVSLGDLLLNDNNLSEMPIGIFSNSIDGTAVLSNLTRLKIEGNKVDPIPLTVTLVKVGSERFKMKIPSGAPFEVSTTVSVSNGSIPSPPDSLVVMKGGLHSKTYSVARGNDISAPTTVDIGELPSIPSLHSGYVLQKSADLPLQIFESVLRPIGGAPAISTHNALLENFPNPFNPETWIPYQLSEKSRVRLTIYSLRGIIVRDINLGIQAAGFYTARSKAAYWDGKNEIGERVSSGIYFYQLKANKFSAMA